MPIPSDLMTPSVNTLTPEVWLEQAELLREIQHLKTAARLLAIGRPERARASEAAMDLAKAREARLLTETREVLCLWSQAPTTLKDPSLGDRPPLSDHGDQLLWLLEHLKRPAKARE